MPVKVGEADMTKVLPVPVCEAIDVALPTDVMGPVRLAFVVTVPALPDTLPVTLPVRFPLKVPATVPVKVGEARGAAPVTCETV